MAHGEYELTLFLRVVKPFVGGIKFRQDDDQYPHPTDRPVPHTRSDHDAHADVDRNGFVVQLHASVLSAFQKVIRLGECLVIMEPCFLGDVRDVQRCGIVADVREGSTSRTARTGRWWDVREVHDFDSPN